MALNVFTTTVVMGIPEAADVVEEGDQLLRLAVVIQLQRLPHATRINPETMSHGTKTRKLVSVLSMLAKHTHIQIPYTTQEPPPPPAGPIFKSCVSTARRAPVPKGRRREVSRRHESCPKTLSFDISSLLVVEYRTRALKIGPGRVCVSCVGPT